eukprot:TRINITY_DN2743_c0_g1_i4.p1 TRINITY_DN2743_c0_g1~~TRINITY_DN2743_c0_g1_i4.p1  ORF type:complete len:774 (-),score=118.57 TRINITY_DN2743_c0_g1_i4:52-2373(-)
MLLAQWVPTLMCDGAAAEDRAQWLVREKGFGLEAAREAVMKEFPALFGLTRAWAAEKLCDGLKAADRARWLIENQGKSEEAAAAQQPLPRPMELAVHAKILDGSEPNPPQWPPSVHILNKETGYQIVDEIYAEMSPVDRGQFSTSRYAIMFETSAEAHEVDVRIGYYTSVYGLGRQPKDTKIRSVTCTNETKDPELGSLQNFWRSAENFQTGQHPTYMLDGNAGMLWAVSQAAPLRRVVVEGNLYLWYFRMPPEGVPESDRRYPFQGACLEYPGWKAKGIQDPFGDFASGGYAANVSASGFIDFGSQQQFFLRNCSAGEYKGGAWNFVLVGCPGAKDSGVVTAETKGPVFTAISHTKVVAEKPFVIKEGDRFKLVVPSAKTARSGVDYDVSENEIRDFSNVFVANPSTATEKINEKLSSGKDVVFTPGIYNLTTALRVCHNEQVLLGLGLATLVSPESDEPCILVRDGALGVRISGFMLEAFYKKLGSKAPRDLPSLGPDALLQWGSADCRTQRDPASLESWGFIHDCFARVGGQEAPHTARDEADGSRPTKRPGQGGSELFPSEARCRNMVQMNCPCVSGDNLWLWRADHWLSDQYLVYNHDNACDRGLHVGTGAFHVTIYGLFVEHTLSDMTLWEGEHGTTYFYQSELPYDALDEQAAAARGLKPFRGAGYRVTDEVQNHEAFGVGVYCFFRDHNVSVPVAVQVPSNAGVQIKNALTKYLNGGPAHFEHGEALLQCGRKYGTIQAVVRKGTVGHGSSTNAGKDDPPHFASA